MTRLLAGIDLDVQRGQRVGDFADLVGQRRVLWRWQVLLPHVLGKAARKAV